MLDKERRRPCHMRLGEDNYRLSTNNREHFCVWCRCGENRSEQVERWLAWSRRMLDATLGTFVPLFGAVAVVSTRR